MNYVKPPVHTICLGMSLFFLLSFSPSLLSSLFWYHMFIHFSFSSFPSFLLSFFLSCFPSIYLFIRLFVCLLMLHCLSFLNCCWTTIGQAFGAAAMLLAMGKKGSRFALPNATIMINQPKSGMCCSLLFLIFLLLLFVVHAHLILYAHLILFILFITNRSSFSLLFPLFMFFVSSRC